jgi:putative effector of murein hydrolase
VVFTGMFGIVSSPKISQWTGINGTVAKGLALGTTAQIIGAVHAGKWEEVEAAMGMMGMIIPAVLVSLAAPFVYFLI